MMEWMSRILVGGMAGADEDFGLEVGQMWLIFHQAPTLLIQPSMIHMDQMILSEPSIIIIGTHQDMMECEYDPNKLHTTEILVADIAFVFLFHTRQSNRNNAMGRDTLPNWGNHRYWMVRENAS